MRLNKKGTKVLLEPKYRVLGLSGLAIQFGIPFWYVAHRYDLFTFKNEGYAVTGWGMVLGAIALIASKKKIQNAITNYNEHLSITAQRAKYGHVFLTIALILALSSVFINGFLWFFGSLVGGNYLSLIPYYFHDRQIDERKELQQLLDNKNKEAKVEKLKSIQAKPNHTGNGTVI